MLSRWQLTLEPSGLWFSFTGDDVVDSLLTGEMSLLLLWLATTGLEGELGFTGICHDGILGAEGEGGNCLLGEEKRERKGKKGAFIISIEGLSLERMVFVLGKSCKARLKLQGSLS